MTAAVLSAVSSLQSLTSLHRHTPLHRLTSLSRQRFADVVLVLFWAAIIPGLLWLGSAAGF